MVEILQKALPAEMTGTVGLPGIAPCAAPDWLRVDEAYGAQMAYRAALIAEHPKAVLWMDNGALEAAQEVLSQALSVLPGLGFDVTQGNVHCPDGRVVAVNREDPLHTLGHLVQEDICILQKRGDEHVLTGAVLCFPASWRLADKVGRPLTDIHVPVREYDNAIARRVQRLFDGVQVGRPLWRYNRLSYAQANLHQPNRIEPGASPQFTRSERQCVVRMPATGAVVFSIHTWVVRR